MGSLEELTKLFINNFIGGQRYKCSLSNLLTKEQGKNESMQSFITRVNREALMLDEMDHKLLLAAFHNGVNSNLFIHKLYEQEPQTMAELVYSTQNFMNAKYAIITKNRKKAEHLEADLSRHLKQGPYPKKDQVGEKKDRDNKKASSSGRSQLYTPLNMPLEQVENLIKQGKLRNFLGRDNKDEKLKVKVEESSRPPLGEIRVIIGGTSTGQSSNSRKTYIKTIQNVQLSGRSPRTRGMDEQAITFTDKDAKTVHHPYDDAIVTTLLITDYTTRRVLVDNRSSADILYYHAF
ncbi:uncharacterized protein LOC142616102 [Castanea sativa]|uniref:uncharacterized protein LOC142616102 n=1 Tax=Castanea sativa TaxID=21020 RepID=UPI003F64CBED